MLKLLELLHLLETGSFSRNRRKRDKVARLLRMQRRASAGLAQRQGAAYDKGALAAQAAWAVQLLGVWRAAYAVIDEVDMVFHPLRSELNWLALILPVALTLTLDLTLTLCLTLTLYLP